MRFIEIPALITEDIEVPNIVEITEPITVSISGTTLTIDGGSKVSGEASVTLTGDVTINAFTLQNIKQPSIHKISVKTNRKGNFTYVPNDTVTASSISTTTKTGSDFEILLITTTGGETYVDFDMADYTSPAVYTSNALTGFDISELTSTYGATAKLYKPDGTLLTTVNSVTTGKGVNFGYTESTPGEVTYTLEVEDDLGRKSKYDLPRKWISYAMETNSTPGFEKLELAGNEYTSTTIVPNISPSSKVRVHKTGNHGYLGINFKIQGRNSTNGAWVDIDDTGENENDDESKEFLAFGDYLYHRVWVKPTAKATATVSSSNVVTLSLTDFTEENLEKSFENFDPFDIDETSNTYVFEETSKVGTIPFTLTIGDQTYSNAFTATTEEFSIPTEPNTDFTAAGPNMLHLVGTSSQSSSYMAEASGDGKYIAFGTDGSGNFKIMKGDPETGYADYATATFSGASQVFGSISYDGKYIIVGSWANATNYEIFKHDESTGTYTKLSTTYPRVSTNDPYTHKPAFVPRSGNYDFALTGSDNNATCYIKLYKHNAGTDTWTEQPRIQDPTGRPNSNRYRGQFSKSFTRDGKYLMFGTYSTYGGYEMYTIDWDANTAVFSGANWVQNNNIGHSGAVTPDGKYVLIFHNNSDSRKIFKNNDAGDWSSATDVTSDFTFNNGDDDQGGDICFFGEHGQYYISRMGGSNVRIYKWLDVTKKSVSLTYNDKDRITITKTGGLTTTTDKLYKDGVLYETLNSISMIFISETGVYQVISDDKYYSNKITVTTVSETESVLRIGHRTCFLLRKDGKVMYWGESHNGSNGMGNTTETVNPTLHENLNAIPGGIKHIGGNTGDSHAKCAISGNGKLYTWGYNGHGSLGRNNTSNYENQGPWLVDTQASNTFTRCLSGYYTNFALQDNGYLWGCGYNGAYELADGSNTNRYQFVRLNIENVMDFCITHHLGIAVTTNNTVYMWGNNNNSAMGGLGTRTTPTQLTTLDGKNIVKVRCSHQTGYAISSDGKLYAWGYGGLSLLPYGSTGNIGTPTEMTWFSRKNIKLVDLECGWHDNTVCLALDDKGNMYVWGKDGVGALGDEVDAPNNSHWPFLLKTNIETISVGYTECGCIDKFGQVYTWGNGTRGAQNWIHGVVSDTHIYHPTSNNLSTGTTLIYDGYDTLKLGKNSSMTSTMLYGSNTLSLDTKSDIFIKDPLTYTFKVSDTSSGILTYLSNVVSTVSRPTGSVYPPKSGTRKGLGTRSTSANHKHTWTIDGAVYGNGVYTAYSSGNLNSANQSLFECFDGHINQTCFHSANNQHLMSIILEMPQKIKLTKYAIYSRNYTGEYTYAPRDWKVYGSNDGTNWTELDSRTNETVSSWGSQTDHRDTKREYTVSGNTKYFSQYKYRVYVTNGSTYTVLSQIEYYGDEDEDFITYDGFGKITVDTKGDMSATSNITYYSNTYELGTARDLYITDTGTGVYNANIYGSTKVFLGSKSLTVSAIATENIWKSNEDQILYADDAEASDYFGFRVDIDGDYAVVSANGEDTGGSNAGAVYIFYKSNGIWTQQAKILPSDVAAGDDISHVAISGDYVLFGAYRKNSYVGAAYIFKRSGTTWTQHTKLTADDGEANDEYGHAVSIDGDYAVVGAWFEDTNGSNAGAAYIYKRDSTTDTWSQQQKIQSSDIQAGDHFTGYSVSINGNYLVLSAFGKDGTVGTDSGAAYIFKRDAVLDTWTQHQKLEPSDIQANDNFGWDVSLDGDYVAISSRYEDDGGSNAGAVYIFKRDAVSDIWTQQQKITTNDVEADDYFGWNVSIDGDRIVVGANNEDTRGSNAGAAYIFERSGSTWSEVKKITAGDAQANDSFGYSVAIDGDTIFVGSINKDTNVTDAGAVYVFEKGTKAVPTLNFDGYNKLTIENVDTVETATIKKDGAAFATTTSNTVYIRDTGTYTAEVKGSKIYATELSTDVDAITNLEIPTGPKYYVFTFSDDVGSYSSLVHAFAIFENGTSIVKNRTQTDLNDPTNKFRFNDTVVGTVNYGVIGKGYRESGASFNADGYNGWRGPQNTIYGSNYYNFYRTNVAIPMLNEGDRICTFIRSVDQGGRTGTYDPEITINIWEGDTEFIPTSNVNLCSYTNSDTGISTMINELSNWGTKVFEIPLGDSTYEGTQEFIYRDIGNGNLYFYAKYYYKPLPRKSNIRPSITYDNYNKITLEYVNQEDTTSVIDPNGAIHEIGTAKTMYVKDTGEYVFKISGTDKYVESNVYVSSVDLAGAPTKPIDFDGYNKLTLIDAGSNVSANVTYFSNTYELGSANVFYINGAGTYDLEMSGSNVFALSSNVVNAISTPVVSGTHRFKLEDGIITDENDNSQTFSSGGTFEADVLRKDGKTSLKVTPGINKNFTLPTAMPNWCVSMWVFIPYITSYGSSNSNDIPSDFSSYATTFGWNWHAIFTYHMSDGKEFQLRTHYNWILHEKSSGSASSDTNTFEWKVNSSIGSNNEQTIHGGNNSDNSFWPEAWHHMALEYNGTTGNLTFYIDGNAYSKNGTFSTGCSLSGFTLGDNSVYNAHTHNGSSTGSPYPFLYFSDIVIAPSWNIDTYNLTKGTYKHFLPIPNPLSVRQLRGQGNEKSTSSPSLTFDGYNKLTLENFTTTDKEWPPPSFTSPTFSTSTVTGVTTTNNGRDQTWTISGASYGNGEYSASYNNTVLSNANYHGPVRCFDKVNDGYAFHSSSIQTGIVTLNMPEKILLDSYELRHRPNANTNENHAPRDWTLEASNDGTTWDVLDTQANQSYSPDVQGDEASKRTYTVSDNVTEYSRYRLNITANDGGAHLVIGQWKLFEKNTRTATLTDPNGDTYSLGQTQNDIYIEDTGDYVLEVTNSDQSAVVTKNVGTIDNIVPESTITYPVYKATSDTQPSSYYTAAQAQNKRYDDGVVKMDFFNFYNGALSTQWTVFDGLTTGNEHYNLKGLFTFEWKNNVVKKVTKMRIWGRPESNCGNSFKTEIKATSSDSWTTLNTYDRTTDYTNDAWNEFPINQEVNACRLDFQGFGGGDGVGPNGYWHYIREFEVVAIDDSVPPPPSLTFDTYNKLSIENLTPISSNLRFGSNTYDIGTASNVYIEDTGTYKVATGDANTFALVSNVVSGSITRSQVWNATEDQILYASDGSANNNFGRSCAMWGSYMVVGSFEGESNTQGAIYIYKKESGTWTFKQKISGEGANDYFSGYGAVDIHEDTIIVGAYKHGTNDNTGKAYIYTRSGETWSLESSIVSDDLATDDKFGISVSVHGDYAVVGAQLDDGPTNSGAGYIFYRNGTSWSQQQKLNPGADDENVGTHVSIYGDYVVLSGKRSGSDLRGRAHVYKRSGTTWGNHTVISNPNPASNDLFSERLSITDGYLAIGSDADDPGGTSDAGQVYVFKHSGTNDWTLEATLEASDKTSGMRFASGISMTPNVLVVGAHQEGTGGANAGAVYIYERSGTSWTEVKKVVASDAASGDRLGYYVGVNNDGLSFVAGAYGESTKGTSAGAAYVYEKVYVGPTITYDASNKLSIENLTPTSTILTDPNGTSFDIGTASNVYIRDSGTYSIVSKDANTFVLASNTVTDTPTGTYTYTETTGTTITPLNIGIDGLTGWYDANSFNTTTQTWIDLSGNGNDANRTRGTVYKNETGLNGRPIIYGGTGDGGIEFPSNAMGGAPTTYTIFTVAKYGSDQSTSGTRGRIFNGYNNSNQGNNWLTGFWSNNAGVAHHGTWITQTSDIHGYNWVLGTSQHSMYRSNGTNRTTGNGANGPTYFFINSSNESTTWSVAEVILYKGKNLTLEEYTKVEEYLNGKYDITPDVSKNYSNSTTTTISGTTPSQTYDNTKTITVSNVPSYLSNVVGNIYKGATAYPIHATTSSSNVIIKNTGTYVSVFTTATQAFFTNKIEVTTQPTTTSEDNTIEDEPLSSGSSVSATLVFHHDTFANSDDPHGDGSITTAATNGHVYSDTPTGTYTWGTLTSGTVNDPTGTDSGASRGNHTPGNTTYKWTPPGTIKGARMLLVGGGGGAGMNMGGGGGAGGFLAIDSKDIPKSEQTVVVGQGGYGSPGQNQTNPLGQTQGSDNNSYNIPAYNGGDSSIAGETAYGGGSGGYSHNNDDRQHGGNGGSGGGASGYHGNNSPGGTGVPGQGNNGGNATSSNYYSGGGGGAGQVGVSANNEPHGGDGLPSDILGTEYWWSGGGGGAGYSINGGDGGKGGGGGGAIGSNPGGTGGLTDGQAGGGGGTNQQANTPGGHAGKHTGGGGGGGAHYQGNNYGGNGGSGIVIIKFTAQEVGFAGSTAVPDETTITIGEEAPSETLDVSTTTIQEPTLNFDFTVATSKLARNVKRYNGLTNSSIGARFNRRESRKKRVEKSISIPTRFSAELTANNASSPTTLTVTVSNSRFYINGESKPTLAFIRGETYTFDQSDASNSGHPLVLATSEDGATQYTTGWTASGTPGTDGSHAFIVPYDVPDTIYYKCNVHPNMGGEINTTFGNVFSLGDFDVAANTHVSGEYTLAVNYDGTTSNLYVNGDLITQTTPTITAGVKEFILGKEFDGYVKNFKFWNYVKSSFNPPWPYLSVTATAKTFDIGGTLGGTYNWYAIVDDDSRLDSDGKAKINNVIQYQWDLYHPNTSIIATGQNNKITFVPGTTVDNGTWYWLAGSGTTFGDHDSETFPASRTRLSNQTCDFSTWETTSWETADAFVDGIIPTLGIN